MVFINGLKIIMTSLIVSVISSLHIRSSSSSSLYAKQSKYFIKCIHSSRSIKYRQSVLRMSSPTSSSSSPLSSSSSSGDGNVLNNDSKKKLTSTSIKKEAVLTVYVDTEIRSYLNMKNSDRKARLMLPQDYGSSASS